MNYLSHDHHCPFVMLRIQSQNVPWMSSYSTVFVVLLLSSTAKEETDRQWRGEERGTGKKKGPMLYKGGYLGESGDKCSSQVDIGCNRPNGTNNK